MAKLTDKFFNRVIEGKLVAESGDELPKELPPIEEGDAGKVLMVNEDEDGYELNNLLPEVSAEDNGSILKVVDGVWAKGSESGGTQLHEHKFKTINDTNDNFVIDFSASPIEIVSSSTAVSNHYAIIITTRATKYTSWNDIADDIDNIEAVYIYSVGTGSKGILKPATINTANLYIDGPVSYGGDSSHHTLYLSKERLSGSAFTNYTIDGQSV